MNKIAPLNKDGPTFLEIDFANRVIEVINAIIQARVTPAGAGKFVITPQGLVLDLAQVKATAPAGAPDVSNLQAQISALAGQINAIKASIQAASISINCNTSTGVITATITFPNFPP